jgi:carbonic anhydrase/acetyltransferase-like protein (isoleucine patch superfamily)
MTGLILPYRGKLPRIASNAFIAQTAVVTGDVEIGEESGIWFNCVIRGDVHEIRIGARTNIQDGTVVHCTRDRAGCYIGSGVTVGHGAILHACTLQDDCFVGMGAILLDECVIETGWMVAAGALVPPKKVVKSGELWAGNPAKMMRQLSPEEIEFFPKSARHYVDLANDYRLGI